jgi:S1-C subfamily serine protease
MANNPSTVSLLRSVRVLLTVLIGVLVLMFLLPRVQNLWISLTAEPRVVTPRGELAASEKTNIDIFREASPSVVFITSLADRINYWTRDITRIPRGTGSGFLWDEQGHFVTNYHVIQDASAVHIRLNDQRTYKAVFVGASPDHDIAVLRMPIVSDMPAALPIGTSHDLQVGQAMYAIGNPFGLDYTLTTGVVSALNRSLDTENGATIDGLIQTDAAINPGNSGGPLLDSAGRLVGINTAIYSPSGAYAGIGFAVPIDTVNRVVPQLIAHGRYQRPQLGITTDDRISQQVTAKAGIKGVVVIGVGRGSPAEDAGLHGARIVDGGELLVGDIILSLGGQRIEDRESLLDALELHRIGDRVALRYLRGREEQEVQVVLE